MVDVHIAFWRGGVLGLVVGTQGSVWDFLQCFLCRKSFSCSNRLRVVGRRGGVVTSADSKTLHAPKESPPQKTQFLDAHEFSTLGLLSVVSHYESMSGYGKMYMAIKVIWHLPTPNRGPCDNHMTLITYYVQGMGCEILSLMVGVVIHC